MIWQHCQQWRKGMRLLSVLALSGCAAAQRDRDEFKFAQNPPAAAEVQLASAELPVERADAAVPAIASPAAPRPFSLDADLPPDYWDVGLPEVIQLALANSTVLRDLGARLVQAPALTATAYEPALVQTDPQLGVEAALSEFDAQLASRVFYERNDRALNNALLGGGTNFFRQDLWQLQTELAKQTASGTRFAVRHQVEDDLNNAPRNIFGTAPEALVNAHAWTWNAEAEVRQPLLQGNGAMFNRLAGPQATPGAVNGVVIARVNANISAADFETRFRDYLSNVENAYWDLAYAYRDLDVKKHARDEALATWKTLKTLQEVGDDRGIAEKLAYAEEQYYRFQQDVEDALSGRLLNGTQDFNGSSGGTFQGAGGVFVAERRLRNIVGLPITDGRLMRPVTEPTTAEVAYDWNYLVQAAMNNRPELKRQRLVVRRREYELQANRNFLLPRLDAVALYRYRGLGDGLYASQAPLGFGGGTVGTATDEWQIGLEFATSIGFRREYAAVRNAALAAARERAVLEQIERQVIHDLSNALADVERARRAIDSSWNRRVVAERQVQLLKDPDLQEEIDYSRLIDAERRSADAVLAYHRAVTAYAIALKNVHLEAGQLMQYCNVEFLP